MIVVVEDINLLQVFNSEIEEVFKSHHEWCMLSKVVVYNSYISFFKNTKFNLFFVLNKNDDKIESYIPLCIDEKGTLRFIFDLHTDYCGIIGKKVNGNFLKDLAILVQTDRRIKRIDFDNLLLNDLLLNGFKYYMKSGVCISSYNSHSYIYSDKEKGYFSSLKAKDRSELKRVSKKNNNTIFSTFLYPDVFPLQEIISLRDKMIINCWRNKDFLDDHFLQFIKSLYEAKELILIVNSTDVEMISLVFTFKNTLQNSFIFWITLYDQNVQYINLTTYLNFISSNEFKDNYYYSFARGDYAFKTTFSPTVENLYNLRYSKSKWDFFFTNYYPIKEFVKRIVKAKK